MQRGSSDLGSPSEPARRLTSYLPSDPRTWLVTLLVALATYLLAAHSSSLAPPVVLVPVFVVLAAALAAFGARLPKAALVGSALLVALVLANLWAPLLVGPTRLQSYGALTASAMREVPKTGGYVNDDDLYRTVFFRMHDGRTYYQAFRDAWKGLRNKPPLPLTVPSYRLPTLYWIWRLLPDDAFLIVYVYLAFASVGCIAAALISGQLARPRFAPLAALALAAYAMGSASTVYVTYVDLPAACLALAGLALFVRARTSRRAEWLWAAAAICVAAALMREILAYLLVLAALASVLEPRGERLRAAMPWLAAIAVFACGYAVHAYFVITQVPGRIGTISYLKGSPAFALDAIRRFSDFMTGGGLMLPILFVLGVVGALAAYRRAGWGFSAFACAALLLPVVGMVKLGNPGIDAAGNQVNYWGNLFVPLALALWPVALGVVDAPWQAAEPPEESLGD